MSPRIFITLAAIVAGPAFGKTCDALKSEIDGKIKANGVKAYTLDVVAAAEVKDRKVVGSCDGGKMKLVYVRAAADSKTAAPKAPAASATPAQAATPPVTPAVPAPPVATDPVKAPAAAAQPLKK
jgi:hypothetical protein